MNLINQYFYGIYYIFNKSGHRKSGTYIRRAYFKGIPISKKIVLLNFSHTNFCHLAKTLSLYADTAFTDKVDEWEGNRIKLAT